MRVIDLPLFDKVSSESKESPRLQRTITSQDLLKTRDARISGRAERMKQEPVPVVLLCGSCSFMSVI